MDVNMGVAIESNVTVGMETGVDADVGTDSKLVVDTSGNVSMGASAEVETGGGTSVTVAGTGANMAVDAEIVPSACAVVSVDSALVGVQKNTVVEAKADVVWGSEMNVVVGSEGKVVAAADAEVSMSHFGAALSLAGMSAVAGVVGADAGLAAAGVVQDVEAMAAVHVEIATVAEGASAKMVTLAGSVVGQTEGKTRLCAAFDVSVAGQDTNTMWGVLSNSGVGTGVHLTPQAGVGV